MENLIVATFRDLEHANAALTRLHELDQLDDIVIYNMVMVRKAGDNLFEYLHREGPDTQDLPAQGAIIGSLAGLIAGPLGMALGMMTGVMAGAIDEDDTDDFESEIKDKVNSQLRNGDYAIVIDLEEDAEFIVDSYLRANEAIIVRTTMTDDYDRYDRQQLDELDREIDDAEKELATAAEARKASVKKKLAALKAKREEQNKKFKTRMDGYKKKTQERMKSLDQKIATAEGKRKEKLQAFKEKAKANLDTFNEKVASALA